MQNYINEIFFIFSLLPFLGQKYQKLTFPLTEIFPALMLESAGCGLHSLTFCWYSVFLEKYGRRAQSLLPFPSASAAIMSFRRLPPSLFQPVLAPLYWVTWHYPPLKETNKKGSNPSTIPTSTFQEKWNDNIIWSNYIYCLFFRRKVSDDTGKSFNKKL